jgi:hypothetical protein
VDEVSNKKMEEFAGISINFFTWDIFRWKN